MLATKQNPLPFAENPTAQRTEQRTMQFIVALELYACEARYGLGPSIRFELKGEPFPFVCVGLWRHRPCDNLIPGPRHPQQYIAIILTESLNGNPLIWHDVQPNKQLLPCRLN